MLGPGMFLHYWNCCFCFWISCYSCSCGCSKFCLFYCFAQLTLNLLQRPVSGTSISFPLLRLYTQSQMYFWFLYSSVSHLYLSASWPCFQNALFLLQLLTRPMWFLAFSTLSSSLELFLNPCLLNLKDNPERLQQQYSSSSKMNIISNSSPENRIMDSILNSIQQAYIEGQLCDC